MKKNLTVIGAAALFLASCSGASVYNGDTAIGCRPDLSEIDAGSRIVPALTRIWHTESSRHTEAFDHIPTELTDAFMACPYAAIESANVLFSHDPNVYEVRYSWLGSYRLLLQIEFLPKTSNMRDYKFFVELP